MLNTIVRLTVSASFSTLSEHLPLLPSPPTPSPPPANLAIAAVHWSPCDKCRHISHFVAMRFAFGCGSAAVATVSVVSVVALHAHSKVDLFELIMGQACAVVFAAVVHGADNSFK